MRVVVVIPVYKDVLDEFELISIKQNLNVLRSHLIVFLGPNSLNFTVYKSLAHQYDNDFIVELFEDSFFTGIDSYNRLLLSVELYQRFIHFDYMLICQLDAFVFRDELNYWCSQGYDYIGAPLIGYYSDTSYTPDMRVGNGGLSLRKVETFIKAFSYTKNLLGLKEIINRNAVFKKPLTRLPLMLLMKFGYMNTLPYFAKNWKYNEDDFWSGFLDNTNYSLSKPTPHLALEFAFERFPTECYKISKKLPFGCHAWEKYEYDEFWSKYIQK